MLLHLDCGAGITGSMTLAALAHLGVDFAPLTQALARVGLVYSLDVGGAVSPAGPGCAVTIRGQEGNQQPRSLAEFCEIFEKTDVPGMVRQRANAVAQALAEACAYARQVPLNTVRLAGEEAEAGADAHALIHILGAAYGFEVLGVDRLTATVLPWFTGCVAGRCGNIPLPRPATAFLLQGKPVRATSACEELISPTGAAFVHALVDEFVPGPQGIAVALGTGYGSKPSNGGLRAWLVQQNGGASAGGADHAIGGNESVMQFESHIDHLNGEDLGMALTVLSGMPEVLDVLWLPGVGKKNRPAGLLRVLCLPGQYQCVADAVLRHTHTLGLRVQCLERIVAPRHAVTAEVAGQPMPAKAYVIDGQTYVRPEADALEAAARQRGIGVPALRNAQGNTVTKGGQPA